jgi:hypothetical protein
MATCFACDCPAIVSILATQEGACEKHMEACFPVPESQKANQTWSIGAVRPSIVWYRVFKYIERMHADGSAHRDELMTIAKFRFEDDAITFADCQRITGTHYRFAVKAGR